MSDRGEKMSRADIAREAMIERARQRAASEPWVCNVCGVTNEPTAALCVECDATRGAVAPRFPSRPEKRRAILNAIASKNAKYARPFDQGDIAVVSLMGTESWSDYGAVVLQMATLDTLLSIEAKLAEMLERLGEVSGGEQESSTFS
jgi:hypothetical protein